MFWLTKNRLPTDFNVYISKRTGKMRRLFWNVGAYCFRNSFLRKLRFTMLIFEFFIFQWVLPLKHIPNHLFQLVFMFWWCLHHSWWFWTFSEIFIFGARGSIFWDEKMSHIGPCALCFKRKQRWGAKHSPLFPLCTSNHDWNVVKNNF